MFAYEVVEFKDKNYLKITIKNNKKIKRKILKKIGKIVVKKYFYVLY